jgi:hypothetical protein
VAKTAAATLLTEETIVDKIYLIRDKKVMLDRDLAELYGVQTRALNQAVRRNARRFPEDFMFQLTPLELQNWISQFVTSNSDKMGLRKPPLAFTELGVAMLSSVLNSETAIDVNIQIIRIFNRMRELMTTNKDILLKIEQMEKNFLKHDARITKGEADIRLIFEALKRLLTPPKEPRPRVGFRRNNERD